ncbi:hypothetical protein PVL29_011638 [Vitis rotundifolia]|uniref:Polygalacturonase n=1 Tax=Vitis rotundifolia TaxID=103349 RepID=A0AA38ZPZ7_VITRO|nr:hypothetical protein PVL29_011638 [Vitis rotundifolia]
MRAWNDICSGKSDPNLVIPGGKTFLLWPVQFYGPCKPSQIYVEVSGRIVAPRIDDYGSNHLDCWIGFWRVNGLTVKGNGQIDGQGAGWWEAYTSAMGFYGCDNLLLQGLNFINSQRNHISVAGSNGAAISHLTITAPDESPNTDGIDISHSTNVRVSDCTIGTGDDCIAFGDQTSQVFVKGVACGPGHGISVGSLGINGGSAQVEEIHVDSCIFKGTQNGARIKTWQGGSGYARKITFNNIKLDNARNPIIIDQFYCPHRTDCQSLKSAVQISDVSFTGFSGTSATDNAIKLSCSETVGCTNISLEHIDIKSASGDGETYSSCINAHGTARKTFPHLRCLK